MLFLFLDAPCVYGFLVCMIAPTMHVKTILTTLPQLTSRRSGKLLFNGLATVIVIHTINIIRQWTLWTLQRRQLHSERSNGSLISFSLEWLVVGFFATVQQFGLPYVIECAGSLWYLSPVIWRGRVSSSFSILRPDFQS